MSRDARIFLSDILESIELVESYAAGISKSDFKASRQIQDSVFRQLEIVGEAVKNIPENMRAQYPEVPWQNISGMRDILIHE